jgi:hypothetical protein
MGGKVGNPAILTGLKRGSRFGEQTTGKPQVPGGSSFVVRPSGRWVLQRQAKAMHYRSVADAIHFIRRKEVMSQKNQAAG